MIAVLPSIVLVTSWLRTGDGKFSDVSSATEKPPDRNHVEGAIELTVEGKTLLSTAEWDDVDQLWIYLTDLIETFLRTGTASTWFPDQPIRIQFDRGRSGRVSVEVEINDEVRRTSATEEALMESLRAAGSTFFQQMSRILPENSGNYDIANRKLMGTAPGRL